MNFDSFYTELISDQRWFELCRNYREETIKKAAEKVYGELVTRKIEDVKPMEENRIHILNILRKGPEDKPKPKPWYQQEAEKKEAKEKEKEPEWIPLTGEERQKKLAEFKAIIDAAPIINGMPPISKKQAVEEGGWIPAKPAPYPITTPEEAYVRDRHFEWVKNNFESKTGYKLPSWICEEDWNVIYDDQHLTNKGK